MCQMMLRLLPTRVKRFLQVIRYGLLTLRYAGPGVALMKLWHQLHGRVVFLGVVRQLQGAIPPPSFEHVVARATPEDVREVFSRLDGESSEGRYQLLVRRWYHEKGFGDCYVTRTSDTNEICFACWMVTPGHVHALGWEHRFPVEHDAVLLENVYTFERFRGRGLYYASFCVMESICLELGHKRAMGWPTADNVPDHKVIKRLGWLVFERVRERHFLFRTTRKTIERYDPPVPIEIPGETAGAP